MIYHVPYIIRKVLPQLLWQYASTDSVYLTFDDGPVPEATPYVLEALAEYGAKATFFCVGDNVRKYPMLYQQIIEEGHAVGNHTYHHKNGWKTDTSQYLQDVAAAAAVIDSPYFRPPYGKLRPTQMKMLAKDYSIVMWDVLSGDYDPKRTPEQCLQTVVQYSKPGSIIVFHDSVKAIATLKIVLPQVLQAFADNKWRMDILKDPKDL